MAIDRTLRLIVTYKLVRAATSVLGALALVVMLVGGFGARSEAFVSGLHDHAASALSLWLSKALMSAVEPKHVKVVVAALLVDGVVVFLEGWALWRGWRWGPWLVIGVSALLLPFEVFELVQRLSTLRLLVLLLNVAIVAWLLHRQWRERRAIRHGP